MLAAAERAIAGCGADVTMDQIAAEAEVTKPILYRTIGDKAAVVDAMSDVVIDRIGQAIGAATQRSAGPRETFAASIRAYLAAVDADRNLYLFVTAAGQPMGSLRQRIDRSAEQLIEMFSTAPDMAAPSTSPITWSHSIVGTLQVVTLMWMGGGPEAEHRDVRTIDQVADDITALLWPGVADILGSARNPID